MVQEGGVLRVGTCSRAQLESKEFLVCGTLCKSDKRDSWKQCSYKGFVSGRLTCTVWVNDITVDNSALVFVMKRIGKGTVW